MALELKIESLRARGELSAQERDRLIQLLEESPPPSKQPKYVTRLRAFLLGVILGVGIAYFTWGVLSWGA